VNEYQECPKKIDKKGKKEIEWGNERKVSKMWEQWQET